MVNSNKDIGGSVMFAKSAILTTEEKILIRQSLFLYQKSCYQQHGGVTSKDKDLISSIVDKLKLHT